MDQQGATIVAALVLLALIALSYIRCRFGKRDDADGSQPTTVRGVMNEVDAYFGSDSSSSRAKAARTFDVAPVALASDLMAHAKSEARVSPEKRSCARKASKKR